MSLGPGAVLWVGLPSAEIERAADWIEEVEPGGVILFARDIEEAGQVHSLVSSMREVRPGLAVALDQEGGRVDRLRGLLGPSPSARRLADAGVEAVRTFADLTSQALRRLGVNVDFAPVVDLDHGAEQGAIGDRSFGRDAETVSEVAGAFLGGLAARGVAGCLKHWPGLGRAAADPHRDLPRVEGEEEELAEDLGPFLRLASHAPFVMTAHALYPSLGASRCPVTCCAEALAPLREIGFGGCLVADDLEMGALRDPVEESAQRALEAGCDALLICSGAEEPVRRTVEHLAGQEHLSGCIEQASARLAASTPSWQMPAWDPEGWASLEAEYRRFCESLSDRSARHAEPGSDPTERGG